MRVDVRIDPHCDNWNINAACMINKQLYRVTSYYPAEGNHKKLGTPITEEEAIARILVEIALQIRRYNK